MNKGELDKVFHARAETAQRGVVERYPFPTRYGDMSRYNRLQVIQQEDGDMIVVVQEYPNNNLDRGKIASVEFCVPGSGGGRSSHTVQALRDLARAIERDNKEHPQ